MTARDIITARSDSLETQSRSHLLTPIIGNDEREPVPGEEVDHFMSGRLGYGTAQAAGVSDDGGEPYLS